MNNIHKNKRKGEFILSEGKNKYGGDVLFECKDIRTMIKYLEKKYL